MGAGFDYTDYREVLRKAYEDKKSESPQFTYKTLAEILGMDPGGTFRILNKERHLPARCVSRAIDLLGLTGREAEYFVLMTSYARERGKASRKAILDRALELRDVPRRELGEQEISLLRDWWVAAIRGALEVLDGNANPELIASRIVPTVSVEDVRRTLVLLLDLGIAKRIQGGRIRIEKQHLTIDGAQGKLAVAEFQRRSMELAAESIRRFPRELRDISTLTVTVDDGAFQDIREILRDCRRRIQKRVNDSEHPDRVLQISIAIFPFMPPAGESQ